MSTTTHWPDGSQVRKGVLVVQHIACEPPAVYEDVLVERGLPLHRVEIDEGQPLPDPAEFVAVVVMGGPMGVEDTDEYPWMAEEVAAVARAVEHGVPVWGVCLGAQVLARALGARVYRGERPEVGMLEVTLEDAAQDDPVLGALPASWRCLQWHSDTFDLPAGATRLARSGEYVNQAFVHGSSYGLQFHLEVTPDLLADWHAVPAYAEALEAVLGVGAFASLDRDVRGQQAFTEDLARRAFTQWLDHVVSPLTMGSIPR